VFEGEGSEAVGLLEGGRGFQEGGGEVGGGVFGEVVGVDGVGRGEGVRGSGRGGPYAMM